MLVRKRCGGTGTLCTSVHLETKNVTCRHPLGVLIYVTRPRRAEATHGSRGCRGMT